MLQPVAWIPLYPTYCESQQPAGWVSVSLGAIHARGACRLGIVQQNDTDGSNKGCSYVGWESPAAWYQISDCLWCLNLASSYLFPLRRASLLGLIEKGLFCDTLKSLPFQKDHVFEQFSGFPSFCIIFIPTTIGIAVSFQWNGITTQVLLNIVGLLLSKMNNTCFQTPLIIGPITPCTTMCWTPKILSTLGQIQRFLYSFQLGSLKKHICLDGLFDSHFLGDQIGIREASNWYWSRNSEI